jgi:hypothetical protein
MTGKHLCHSKKNGLRIGKKGFIGSLLYIIVAVFIFAVVAVTMNHLLVKIEPMFNDSTIFNGSNDAFYNTKAAELQVNDSIAPILLVLMGISSFMLVIFFDTHPVFFWITLVFLIFLIIVAGLLANTYQQIVTTAPLNESSGDFIITQYVFEHYVMLVTVLGLIILAGIFLKIRHEGGGV